MTYRAPVSEIVFSMMHEAGLAERLAAGGYADLADGLAEATLEEAAKMAESLLVPLNRAGDKNGAQWNDGVVRTTPGWPAAYKQWCEAGWNGLTGPEAFGGMGLPVLLSVACSEIWNAANMAFALCPLLTVAAFEALHRHGSDELKQRYLAKLVSGEWTGTMQLTEPQAGSDLSTLRTRAEPQPDGTYKLFGTKIFITYGEHDMTENIVHFVLARLPDSPAGTRGISLFLVPKFLLGEDGSLGPRNDVHCASIEHKLGIHASPTCTMIYGDQGGATGWLVGEVNKGLAGMFTMMNSARLIVGIQGVAIADRAYQLALAYAKERRQGRAPGETGPGASPIIAHPDVARMLLLMKAQTAAARAICLMTAAAIDGSQHGPDAAARKQSADRAALLMPIAKAYATDIGNDAAALGVQVHGGMGYVEETGAAQFVCDARITTIYEGTNGIQAADLVVRKLPLAESAIVAQEIADMRGVLAALREFRPFARMEERLSEAVDALDDATRFMLQALKAAPSDALAGATPYLRLFGIARGGTALAKGALAAFRLAQARNDPALAARIALAKFFADNVAIDAAGLARSVVEGAASVEEGRPALAS